MTLGDAIKSERKYWKAVFLLLVPYVIAITFWAEISEFVSNEILKTNSGFIKQNLTLIVFGVESAVLVCAIFIIQRRLMPSCKFCNTKILPRDMRLLVKHSQCPYCNKRIIGADK